MKTKVCSRCRKRRPLKDFGVRRKSRDGYTYGCLPCTREMKNTSRAKRAGRIMEPPGSVYFAKIPSERVWPIFKEWAVTYPWLAKDPEYAALFRSLHRMRFEQTHVTFDFVDTWFAKLELLHLWHVSPEGGGFSDLYHREDCLRSERTGAALPPAARTPPGIQHPGGGEVCPPSDPGPPPLSGRGRTPSKERQEAA